MGAAPNDHRLFEGNDMTTPNIEELPAPETLAQMAEACETLTSLMLIIPGIDVGAWAKTLREADASMQSQAERIKELNLQVVSAFGQAQEALEERDTARAQLAALQVDDELPEPVVIDRHIPTNIVIRGYTADQLRQHAAQVRAKMVPLEKDAERYRWLTDDHADAEMRDRAEDAGIRLRWIGKGAADAMIDAAIDAAKDTQ